MHPYRKAQAREANQLLPMRTQHTLCTIGRGGEGSHARQSQTKTRGVASPNCLCRNIAAAAAAAVTGICVGIARDLRPQRASAWHSVRTHLLQQLRPCRPWRQSCSTLHEKKMRAFRVPAGHSRTTYTCASVAYEHARAYAHVQLKPCAYAHTDAAPSRNAHQPRERAQPDDVASSRAAAAPRVCVTAKGLQRRAPNAATRTCYKVHRRAAALQASRQS